MPTAPPIHLCIIQPAGVTEALGSLDAALHVRRQLLKLGAEPTVAKNRLVHDAVNLVFGAEYHFEPSLRERHCCVFVELMPRGDDPELVALLRDARVVGTQPGNALRLRFRDDPALRVVPAAAPAMRRVDVLLVGGSEDLQGRVTAALQGLVVRASRSYGPERDAAMRDARVVLSLASHFDEPLAAHVLSISTAFAWLKRDGAALPPDFAPSVFEIPASDPAQLAALMRQPGFESYVATAIDAFRGSDATPDFAELLSQADALWSEWRTVRPAGPWRPTRVNIGSGRDYLMGWLNVDILAKAQPDVLLDLGRPVTLPLAVHSRFAGPVLLEPESLDLVFASNVLEHVPDLVTFTTQILALLRTGGEFLIEVPYERAPEAWQDPTHVRAMNENSWRYFTSWFWYMGWFRHRFELDDLQFCDEALEPCERERAHFMRALMRKVETTEAERTHARSMQADFGGLIELLSPERGPADGGAAQG